MSVAPKDLKYTKSHEWVRTMPDGSVVVGITDHAQQLLGDLVFIELPKAGAEYAAGKECAVIESVKAASDVYVPVSGRVIEANEGLGDAPETVNKDAYGDGWLFRMQPANPEELKSLLDADTYGKFVASEDH
ncbi:MAG: glycine cleavage system protein GcvH [Pseudomonadota bacterium]|nr:glycine cleavage system protein GcvH [Pseudomonadota bacterium]